MDVALLEHRRRIALAQLDAFIDVTSAWRDRYEDDDWRAGLGWISDVIGQTSDYENGGHLCDRQNVPSLAWKIEKGVWRFGSLVKGYKWPMTRREFRKLAHENNVSLPSRHATLWLEEIQERRQEVVNYIHEIRWLWRLFKMEFARRHESNEWYAMSLRTLHSIRLHRDGLTKRVNQAWI